MLQIYGKMIRMRVNMKDVDKLVKTLGKRASGVARAAAEETKKIIQVNSEAGVDIKGSKLNPYKGDLSRRMGYIWYGRAALGFQTSPVNLRRYHHLLDDAEISVAKGGMHATLKPSEANLGQVKAYTIMFNPTGALNGMREFYPKKEQAFDKHIPTIEAVGERVMSD
jgi:hypothetical protein